MEGWGEGEDKRQGDFVLDSLLACVQVLSRRLVVSHEKKDCEGCHCDDRRASLPDCLAPFPLFD